jgi:hypothetical protein
MLTVKRWSRWQDWVALVAGVYAALSFLWTPGEREVTGTLIALGALLALVSMWSLFLPGVIASEWAHGVVGVLFIIAPGVMSYTDVTMAAWTSWVVGTIALALGMGSVSLPSLVRPQRPVAQH